LSALAGGAAAEFLADSIARLFREFNVLRGV
jgi:hypothetical protein